MSSSSLMRETSNFFKYSSNINKVAQSSFQSPEMPNLRNFSTLLPEMRLCDSKHKLDRKRSRIVFDARSRLCPHPIKYDRGGEDSCFATDRYLAVADGVGSWSSQGIDPGVYPRELLCRIQKSLDVSFDVKNYGYAYAPILEKLLQNDAKNHLANDVTDPLKILQRAYKRMVSRGSTTCSMIFLAPSCSQVQTLNLGDSGFILYRQSTDTIYGRSDIQTHSFNCPYQLGHESPDTPEKSSTRVFDVRPDDWIVLATDGLWDNLYSYQIIEILRRSTSPREAVDDIVELAVERSQDQLWLSPYAASLKKFGTSKYTKSEIRSDVSGASLSNDNSEKVTLSNASKNPDIMTAFDRFRGGKPDDISVVVARIV